MNKMKKRLPELPLEIIDEILSVFMAWQGEGGPFTRFLTVRILCHRNFALLHDEPTIFIESLSFDRTNPLPARSGLFHIKVESYRLSLPNCLDDSLLSMKEHERIELQKKQVQEIMHYLGQPSLLTLGAFDHVSSQVFLPDKGFKATLFKNITTRTLLIPRNDYKSIFKAKTTKKH